MTRASRFAALVLAAVIVAPAPAWALANFVTQVPNGSSAACLTCHLNASGGSGWNAFGDDVRARLSGGQVDWAAVYALDSDGDGQTNGAELGDPCGTWMAGAAAPRTTDISRPGDQASTSASPSTPACDGSGGGGGMMDEEGGCTCATEHPQRVNPAWALLLALPLLRRRRHAPAGRAA